PRCWLTSCSPRSSPSTPSSSSPSPGCRPTSPCWPFAANGPGSAIAPILLLKPAGEWPQEEASVIGAARPAARQMPLRLGEPVADWQQLFVLGAARRAGREMHPHRGALLHVQRADDVHTDITAPSVAVLAHLVIPLSVPLLSASALGARTKRRLSVAV